MSRIIEIKSYVWQSTVLSFISAFAFGGIHWFAYGREEFALFETLGGAMILAAFVIAAIRYSNHKVRSTREQEVYGQVAKVKGPAGHEMGYEVRAGTLVLTKRHLMFISNGLNLQNGDLKIDLSDIKSIQSKSVFGVFPNSISLQLDNGTSQDFYVPGREQWLQELKMLQKEEFAA